MLDASLQVVVDDILPTGNNGRLLCSASADKTELWVSIIEKAYLKVSVTLPAMIAIAAPCKQVTLAASMA